LKENRGATEDQENRIIPRMRVKLKVSNSTTSRSGMGAGNITDQKVTMATLASQLTQQLGRFVFDRTGLQGEYDFHLEWTPDLSQTNDGFLDHRPGAGLKRCHRVTMGHRCSPRFRTNLAYWKQHEAPWKS
jgi:uncharacterized protein (TIGR03435 family)